MHSILQRLVSIVINLDRVLLLNAPPLLPSTPPPQELLCGPLKPPRVRKLQLGNWDHNDRVVSASWVSKKVREQHETKLISVFELDSICQETMYREGLWMSLSVLYHSCRLTEYLSFISVLNYTTLSHVVLN